MTARRWVLVGFVVIALLVVPVVLTLFAHPTLTMQCVAPPGRCS